MDSKGTQIPLEHHLGKEQVIKTAQEPVSKQETIRISRPLSERLQHFLEQLDLSLRRIDAGLM
jgi:hypothetical protein